MGRKFRLLLAAGTVALAAIAATTALAQTHARGAEPFKIALSNSFIGNKWRIEMENAFKAACGMPPYKTAGRLLRLQLRQRRQQADAADLEPDLAGRRRDRRRRRLGHRPQRDHPAGLRAQHPRRRVRQPRDRAVCDQDQREPVRSTASAERAVHRRQAPRAQGQRDHGHGRGRHAGRHRPQQGRDGRLQEVPGHQGRRQVHRHVGLGDRAAQHRAQLPSLPKIDGVWSSGGTDGIIKAIIDARRPLPTVVGGEARERLPPVPHRLSRQEAPVRALARPAAVQRRRRARGRPGQCSRRSTRRPRGRVAAVPAGDREDGEAGRERLHGTCRTASSTPSPTPVRTRS